MTSSSAERERLLAFSFANADMLLELDAGYLIVFASGALQHLTGRRENELVGTPVLALIEPRDRVQLWRGLKQLAPNARLSQFLTALAQPDGSQMPVSCSAYRLDGEAARYFFTVAVRERAAREVEVRGRCDTETGLLRDEDFVTAAAAQARYPGAKLTMIELGGLQDLKARAEEPEVVELLRQTGATLRAASVDGNVAGRFGANKLGVVHGSGAALEEAAQEIAAMARAADPGGPGIDVGQWTLPLGASNLPADQIARVLRYAVRRFAETPLEDFRPASINELMRGFIAETLHKVSDMRDTIGAGRIGIAYQPIVALSDRKVHHWEALCRPGEQTSAAGVLEFAERFGVAGEFDLLVCSKVIKRLQMAAAEGLQPHIAINLSATTIENDMFLMAFHEQLAPHASLRRQLLIEVTESTRLTDLVRAENVLQGLRRHGHKICLDDFGAGAAAFPYIQGLTIDFVKVDGAYVRRTLADKRDAAIVRAIVQMCADLKIGTVAEMIETEPQAAKLNEIGIGFGQGYLFGRPDKDESFEAVRPPKPVARRKGVTETWQ